MISGVILYDTCMITCGRMNQASLGKRIQNGSIQFENDSFGLEICIWMILDKKFFHKFFMNLLSILFYLRHSLSHLINLSLFSIKMSLNPGLAGRRRPGFSDQHFRILFRRQKTSGFYSNFCSPRTKIMDEN